MYKNLPYGVTLHVIDPNNTIWQFERGGVHGTLQTWSHGCTIFEMNGLESIDDAVSVLKSLRESYGNIRVVNLKKNSSEFSFWKDMIQKNIVNSLGDIDNHEIEIFEDLCQQRSM